jgi:hypothetical protein
VLIFLECLTTKGVSHGKALMEKNIFFFYFPMILGGYQTEKNKGVRYFEKMKFPPAPFVEGEF